MKRYKLLKPLPTFKAGDKFFISEKGNLIAGTPEKPKKVIVGTGDSIIPIELDLMTYTKETLEQFPNILTDWFEEIYENVFYFIDVLSPNKPIQKRNIDESSDWFIERLKSLGNYFETKEKAEKHFEWLKAREVLIQDTKGFKPDWNDFNQMKYHVQYDYEDCEFGVWSSSFNKYCEIHFATEEDAKNSIKEHEEEWKIYLRTGVIG